MNSKCIAKSEEIFHQEECDILLLHRSPTHSRFIFDSDDESHAENAVQNTSKPTLAANLRLRNRGFFRVFPLPKSSRLLRAALRSIRPLPVLIISTLLLVSWLIIVVIYGGIPASYWDVRLRERAFPQHRWEAACPRGRKSMKRGCYEGALDEDSRYFLRFPDHVWGRGFNNVFQEAILTTHLALTSHLFSNENTNPQLSPHFRTPVFEDYVWSHFPLPWTLYDFELRKTRVPLGAYLGGVLAGGDWNNELLADGAEEDERDAQRGRTAATPLSKRNEQRAVSAEYFEFVCPPSRRVEIVYGLPEQDSVAGPPANASAVDIISWWRKRLQQDDVRSERCVVVREWKRRVFDSEFFGSSNVLSIFEQEIRPSPVIKHFEWAPNVSRAVLRSVKRFWGAAAVSRLSPPSNSSLSHPPPPMIPSLLAVHLRRGDYKRHCKRLASWGAQYMGFNGALASGGGDRFEWVDGGRSSRGLEGENGNLTTSQDRKEAYYLEHCLPKISQIVKRLGEVREEYELSFNKSIPETPVLSQRHSGNLTTTQEHYTLKSVYVLTNGWSYFLQELSDKLIEDGWETVFGTSDLEEAGEKSKAPEGIETQRRGGLTKEEQGVTVAIDMGLAESAEVFVGNGFSSLSANVVMLRTVKGFKTMSNRML